ncbi:MAG TPA: hypothetical protein VF108_11765 [Actinomycetota bacterium]
MAGAPLKSIALVTAAFLAACGGSPGDVSSSASAPALEGTWETETIPAAEIRAVVLEAGFTRQDADQVIGATRTFAFELRFEGSGYALHSAWNGEDMGVLEAGGYRLTEGDRLLLDTGDLGDSFLFDLDLRGDRFALRLIRTTENGTPEDEYTHSYFTTAFFTGHDFVRSGSSVTNSGDPTEVPLEGRILFSRIMPSGEFLHFVVGTDGSGETPFAPGKEFEARNLSPNGSVLAISAPNEQGVLVGGRVGVDGTGYRLFESTDPTLNLVCGVWAPDDRLACEGWDDADPSRAGIYTVRASDGSDPKRLTRRRDVPCEYSPDGAELAFIRVGDDDTRGTLMVMDAQGGEPRSLLADVVLTGIPCDWSPDGGSILTASGGALRFVRLDGTSSPLVGDGIDGYAMGGLWSPDGSHVLFSMAFEGQRSDVYTAAADGSDLTRVAGTDLLEESAYWLP